LEPSRESSWKDHFFEGEDDEDGWDDPEWADSLDLDMDNPAGDGFELLQEAHEAINRLYQKTNKRGRLMRQPRRADSWQ
jgi:hypothetical protein